MAELSADPRGYELEDFVAAHLASRAVFLDCGVTHRDPTDILELDVVWTDHRNIPAPRIPIEVKSGAWGLGDLFKFYGWSQFLGIQEAVFICRELPGRTDIETVRRLCEQLNIKFIHVNEPEEANTPLDELGLGNPPRDYLPEIWRYSFWLNRRLDRALGASIRNGRLDTVGRIAKEYGKLVNDAIFFERDPRARVHLLCTTHWEHPKLAASAAQEYEGLDVDLEDPDPCDTFGQTLFQGRNFAIQACLNLGHRARLAILKAGVDYLDARDAGEIEGPMVEFVRDEFPNMEVQFNRAFTEATDELSQCPSFRKFPVLWQTFLYSFGGFLLSDRIEDEYMELADQTGIPLEHIEVGLSCFDRLFPIPGGWFRNPANDVRQVTTLVPAVFRGLGAFSRLKRYGAENYRELDLQGDTARRMTNDHNRSVRLLDGGDEALIE